MALARVVPASGLHVLEETPLLVSQRRDCDGVIVCSCSKRYAGPPWRGSRGDFHELAACSLAALMLVQLPRQRSDTSRRRRVRVSERLHKALEAANISCLTQ